MNISKYTTYRELIEIVGIPDHIRRRIGFNLAGGHVNAVEICVDLYKAPTLDEMRAAYRRKKGLPPVEVPESVELPKNALDDCLPQPTEDLLPGEPVLPEPDFVEADYDRHVREHEMVQEAVAAVYSQIAA